MVVSHRIVSYSGTVDGGGAVCDGACQVHRQRKVRHHHHHHRSLLCSGHVGNLTSAISHRSNHSPSLLMDAAARRRTFDIPKSDSAGLAEWTSKIKALQRQVDEDEEVETRRLEEEILASRMSRMRRSTLQSRPSSHDLCESFLEPHIYPEIHFVSQWKLSTNSQGWRRPHPTLTVPSLSKTSNGIERLQCANS